MIVIEGICPDDFCITFNFVQPALIIVPGTFLFPIVVFLWGVLHLTCAVLAADVSTIIISSTLQSMDSCPSATLHGDRIFSFSWKLDRDNTY